MVITLANPEIESRLAETLGGGGVVIMPCDTIYGLVGLSPDTEERISTIKGRAPSQPYLSLIANESWLTRFSDQGLPVALRRYWPGPLTLIFPRMGGGTIAVRVPEDGLLRTLLTRLDRPLVSTRVNRHGTPAQARVQEIIEVFEKDVDLIVDGGDRLGAIPSTLVDLTGRPYRVLRKGAVDLSPDLLNPL